MAGSASRDDLVIAGDSVLSRRLATRGDLRQVLEAVRGRRGSAVARAALPQLRDRVDSAPESLVRLRVVDGGLPEPSVNPDLFDEAGGWIGRPDLAFETYQVALQYEGDVHRTDPRRWPADIARDEVMQHHGWEIIRVTAADLRDPEQLCRRIRARLQRQAERLGLPMPF